MKLYAPKSYWNASQEDKKKICNGCGAKDGIKVPDTMWGLLIIMACQIHDWMFHEGKTYGDFLFANAIFIFNLTMIIIARSANWFMITLRLGRASKYFYAVMIKGEKAYWVDKEKNKNLNITYKGEIR